MSTEDMSLVSPRNGITSQLVFQDDPLPFNCSGPPAPHQRRVADPKTRELTGFIDDHKLFSTSTSTSAAAATTTTSAPSSDRYFQQGYPRNIYRRDPHGTSGDESDGEDDEDDDDEEEDEVDDDDVDGRDRENGVDILVAAIDSNSKNTDCNNNNSNVSSTVNVNNSIHLDKIGNGNAKPKHLSSFGEMMAAKDSGSGGMGQGGSGPMTIAEVEGEMYYSHYLQGTEGSGGGGKDMGVENGCGFSGRKEASSVSNESGESLRAILSDPVTGVLMDDAMILLCGHSFGGGGIQHVIRMKACFSCSQSISEDSIAPNLSLQAAVQAFRREEELHSYRSSKRRKERFDQDKGLYGDSAVIDAPRGRGVQFPFAVTDRVIIKGNKRTPQRFVGREAVVTTQCLNGWYVVKTLDNAESVKLQYRSLAKVSDDQSSKAMPSKMGPNWL